MLIVITRGQTNALLDVQLPRRYLAEVTRHASSSEVDTRYAASAYHHVLSRRATRLTVETESLPLGQNPDPSQIHQRYEGRAP